MPDVLSRKTVRARKQHTCMLCHQTAAEPGQEYERATLIYDGRIYDWVNCTACEALMPFVTDWANDDEIGEDTVDEWARETAWEADSTPDSQSDEQKAAVAFLARYARMVVDHVFVGVAGHPDDNECTHRADGTDATYCGRREDEHVWGGL
jgi:hypothetical protein